MSDDFYRAFEDRYRGSRDLIKSRLCSYLPFVQALLALDDDPNALDLGCGRGEWLELLAEHGFRTTGIDLDEHMLEPCRALGLDVELGDAVDYLATLADESQTVVSAFHLVEHLEFGRLRTLVSEAERVLKPGGLLIMETPNPENVLVATRDFYLDPTHQRPIPPGLLSFVPEYYGFARTKILRLQETVEIERVTSLTLDSVLGGASPDYAVVAQKRASQGLMSCLDAAFDREYGLRLEDLAARYDQHIDDRVVKAHFVAEQAQLRASQIAGSVEQLEMRASELADRVSQDSLASESRAQSIEVRLSHLEDRIGVAERSAEYWQRKANEFHEQVVALHHSTSWRITRPMRGLKRLLKGDTRVIFRSVRESHVGPSLPVRSAEGAENQGAIGSVNGLAGRAIRYFVRRPALKRWGLLLLRPFPAVESRLRDIRAAQLRAQFMAAGLSRGEALESRSFGGPLMVRGPATLRSLVSTERASLGSDEILARIRQEIAALKSGAIE